MNCNSCGVHVGAEDIFVKFECPNCLEEIIVRCKKCKALINEYICPKCKFVGP